MGAARGTGGAWRADLTRLDVLDARVLVPLGGGLRVLVGSSMSEESGVVGREAKDGRRREVREGEGGRGIGGRL